MRIKPLVALNSFRFENLMTSRADYLNYGKGSWNYCSRETTAKRLQLFNVTCRNIVGGNMLRAFGHHVATCHDVLRHVECFWLKFETGQIFHTTYVDVS